jgi:nucleoside-diphosphate-sugar epimerase
MRGTIVVTGAAGFIGHWLCRRLLDHGHRVTGVDCFLGASYDPAVKRAAIAALRANDAFTFRARDLRVDPLDDIVDGAAAVVHLAAMTGLHDGPDHDELYDGCNVIGSERVARAAIRVGIPTLVHASTSSVYGLVADGDERQPTRPISAYGRSKLAAERLMIDRGAVVLRYFSVYGPGQRPDMAYHRFCEALLEGRPLTIHDDGAQQRANTYIDDVVEATVAALDRGRPGETYNIGGATPVRLLDAVGVLAEALDRRPLIEYVPPRPGDQRATRADTTKARDQLGWRPVTPPCVGLHAQAVWQRARHAGFAAA